MCCVTNGNPQHPPSQHDTWHRDVEFPPRSGEAVTPPGHNHPMARQQLRLIESPKSSRIDERTKAVGRRGLAQARAALADADRRRAERDTPTHPDHHTAA